MGFTFQTAEERNPVPSHEQIQAQKIQETTDKVTKLEKEVTLLNEFLELMGKAHLYDLWKDGLYTPEAEGEVVEFEELSLDDVASLEDEV